jgi:alpha-beta hydrolase superfamily lysophospholipase
VPVCVLQGMKDTICEPGLTKDLFARIPTDHKRMVLYPQGFHEMFNDIGGDKYKKDILVFMTDILKKDCPNLGKVAINHRNFEETIIAESQSRRQ